MGNRGITNPPGEYHGGVTLSPLKDESKGFIESKTMNGR